MTARYSLFLSLAFALGLFLAVDAQAQDREVSSTSIVEVDFAGDRGAMTLRHFDPDGDQVVLGASPGGYVFGTNGYGDLAKAVAFQAPFEVLLLEINAYMFRSASPTLSSYELAVYPGDQFTGPDFPVYVESRDINHIEAVAGESPVPVTVHELAAPLPVLAGPFFVGFQWDATAGVDDIGMVSTAVLPDHSPYEWEMWDDMGWREVATAWGTNGWHVWIEAVVQEPLSDEPGVEPRTFTLSSVYPNPAASESYVDLEMAISQRVSVEVFNLLGQRVATVFEGTAPAGRSVVPVDAGNLTAGMYVVRVVGEDFSQSRKFVVSH